jgi:hypothetical protein
VNSLKFFGLDLIMRDKNFDCLIVMIWRIVSTGLILLFLTFFVGFGCAGIGGGKNRDVKSNIFSFPSKVDASSRVKPKKVKKSSDAPQSLDEILGLPRY